MLDFEFEFVAYLSSDNLKTFFLNLGSPRHMFLVFEDVMEPPLRRVARKWVHVQRINAQVKNERRNGVFW
jgi:hypothetical protein